MTAGATSVLHPRPAGPFCHEALLYAGEEGFVAATTPFLRAGVEAGEPILVAVVEPKVELLKDALGPDGDRIEFVDMAELGRNPSRIIPAWHEFAAANAGGPMRGIGEPVWPERPPNELDESLRHEALLNLAFADSSDFWLVCPYDVDTLSPEVLAAARQTHPHSLTPHGRQRNVAYRAPSSDMLSGLLTEPPQDAATLPFGSSHLEAVRGFVADRARVTALSASRTADLVSAVNEVATNSLRHGGGGGVLRVWEEDGALVCEVRDTGQIAQPLVGRQPPASEAVGGRGLWLANHLCDLVQLRSLESGSVVRLRMDVHEARNGRD